MDLSTLNLEAKEPNWSRSCAAKIVDNHLLLRIRNTRPLDLAEIGQGLIDPPVCPHLTRSRKLQKLVLNMVLHYTRGQFQDGVESLLHRCHWCPSEYQIRIIPAQEVEEAQSAHETGHSAPLPGSPDPAPAAQEVEEAQSVHETGQSAPLPGSPDPAPAGINEPIGAIEITHWLDLGACISHHSREWMALIEPCGWRFFFPSPYDLEGLPTVMVRYEDMAEYKRQDPLDSTRVRWSAALGCENIART